MQPAVDPSVDYFHLVREGYNRCAAAYANARRNDAALELTPLVERLQPGAAVLDIGCGAGVPVTRALAEQYAVTGVDIAEEQIRLAQKQAPMAQYVTGNVMSVDLPQGAYDAVVAMYVVFHIPRQQHRRLFERIYGWLKPGGYLLATVSNDSEPGYTEDSFFGATMYWSNYGLGEYRALLHDVGFEQLEIQTVGHGYDLAQAVAEERHPLILARRPVSLRNRFGVGTV